MAVTAVIWQALQQVQNGLSMAVRGGMLRVCEVKENMGASSLAQSRLGRSRNLPKSRSARLVAMAGGH